MALIRVETPGLYRVVIAADGSAALSRLTRDDGADARRRIMDIDDVIEPDSAAPPWLARLMGYLARMGERVAVARLFCTGDYGGFDGRIRYVRADHLFPDQVGIQGP